MPTIGTHWCAQDLEEDGGGGRLKIIANLFLFLSCSLII